MSRREEVGQAITVQKRFIEAEKAGNPGRCVDELSVYLERLARTLADEVDKWRNAVVDAAVINWTYAKEDEENPYLAVCKLLACAAQEALDPQISLEAKKLHDRIAELEALIAPPDGLNEWRYEGDRITALYSHKIAYAKSEADAKYLCECHNYGLATTAERVELQRRLDEVVKMLEPGEEPMRYMLGDLKVDYRPAARLHARALAIAEGAP